MEKVTQIIIFVGSPSDTEEERKLIPEIIDELNHTLGKERSIKIDKIMWENEVDPTIGLDGQDVINTQIENYDIFFGLMWKKYGFPTPRANSATDEEYTRAVKSYKEGGSCKDIILLFNNQPISVDSDIEQLKKVQEFKSRVKSDGVLYKTYNGIQDFTKVARVALYNRIVALLDKRIGINLPKNTNKNSVKTPIVKPLDDNTKLVFDTLTTCPAVNDVKSKFIESYILLFLFEHNSATSADIISYLTHKLELNDTNLYNIVLGKLNMTDCIVTTSSTPKMFGLSDKKRLEITKVKETVTQSSNILKEQCTEICLKYDLNADSQTLDTFICKLFEIGFSTEINEWSRTAVKKETALKNTYEELVKYLHIKSELPITYVAPIANELITIYSKNPIIYKANASRMFFSLFKNNRLDEYISLNLKEFVLDTQILLQICCVTFDTFELVNADILYKVGKRFWRNVRANRNVKLYTTDVYVEEVANHLCAAYKLSRFLELDYIQDLGPSKNIFFNHYLAIKKEGYVESFHDYICQFLDEDVSDMKANELQTFTYNQLRNIFEDLSIEVLATPEIEDFSKYKKEYEISMSFMGYDNRSYNARKNDIYSVIWCGNLFDTFENTPYLITTDTSFVGIRNRMVEKFNELSYWYVFSPQKISETLSLMNFRVEPTMIDDNIISLVESNFNTSNDTISFIDLLNTFVDDKNLSEWKLAAKLSKIRKLKTTAVNETTLSNNNQPIDEFLLLLTDSYSKRTDGYKLIDLIDIFCDNESADRIAEYIYYKLESFKLGTTKLDTEVFKFFDDLIYEHKKTLIL